MTCFLKCWSLIYVGQISAVGCQVLAKSLNSYQSLGYLTEVSPQHQLSTLATLKVKWQMSLYLFEICVQNVTLFGHSYLSRLPDCKLEDASPEKFLVDFINKLLLEMLTRLDQAWCRKMKISPTGINNNLSFILHKMTSAFTHLPLHHSFIKLLTWCSVCFQNAHVISRKWTS